MNTNEKISENVAIIGSIDPVSQSVGTVTSAWVPVANVHQMMAVIGTGVLGTAATVDAKIQQATDASGTGAKDVTGKAITQIVKATGDNKQVIINFRGTDLDVANSFNYVRISLTVGAAASLVGAYLFSAPKFQPADAFNQAAVAQVV